MSELIGKVHTTTINVKLEKAVVTSVNEKTGAVTLDKSDIGLENVDNTSDIDKPVSTATQTALNAKTDLTIFNNHSARHEVGGLDEISVAGLSGVLADRQDANKIQGRAVQDIAPQNDYILVWSSANSRWEPHTLLPNNAGAHNSIFRGKYLGSSVTTEQYAEISNGTFEDLYIGDYWTISNINWRIAAFNYYYNTGDTALTVNHITLVPDTILYYHVMNDTDTTTGGYIGSKMYTTGLTNAKNAISSIFGTHLVQHRQLLCNAATNGVASGWAWYDSTVELMTEPMVHGSIVFGQGGFNIGLNKSQLSLFALSPQYINTRQTYWLRDVAAATYFAYVNDRGSAHRNYASYSYGVRPAFSIS